MPKISCDRRSGERRGARLERQSARRDEYRSAAIDVIKAGGKRRHRQQRRWRHKRIGDLVDAGADRAVIVVFIAGLRRRQRLGGVCLPSDNRRRGICAPNTVEMNVPEGNGKLNGQRDERQPARKPAAVPKPKHGSSGSPPHRLTCQDRTTLAMYRREAQERIHASAAAECDLASHFSGATHRHH